MSEQKNKVEAPEFLEKIFNIIRLKEKGVTTGWNNTANILGRFNSFTNETTVIKNHENRASCAYNNTYKEEKTSPM